MKRKLLIALAAAAISRLAADYLLPDCSARRKELRSKVFAGCGL